MFMKSVKQIQQLDDLHQLNDRQYKQLKLVIRGNLSKHCIYLISIKLEALT